MRLRTLAVGMLAVGIALATTTAVQATITIATVPVDNPGNATDTTGYGAVAYPYNIGTYEVTAAQYAAFLNAVARTDTYGLYNTQMGSDSAGCQIQRSGSSGSYTYSVAADRANRPVNFVSFGDAMRFANWLHNDQPTGAQDLSTTEDGAYYLNGATTTAQLLWVSRKAGWKWAVPTESEWYKAAYYDPSKPGGAGYWIYPTRTNDTPSNVLSSTGTNNANFNNTIGSPYFRTPVGAFAGSPGPYGTFDQGGNVWEWNQAVIGSSRGIRGGPWDQDAERLQASYRMAWDPATDYSGLIGIRVVRGFFTPPSVEITSPTGTTNAAAGGTVYFAATASTTVAGGVTSVTFYDGSTLLGYASQPGSTWTYAWSTSGTAMGLHEVTARATTSLSGAGTSAAVGIRLVGPPTVAITLPTSTHGAVRDSVVSFVATASTTAPDGSITQVLFYDDQTLLGSAASAGETWTFDWDTEWTAVGLHSITARATGSYGETAASAVVWVNLTTSGDVPQVAITSPTSPYTADLNWFVSFAATASTTAPGGAITGVQFYDGGTLLGSAANAGSTWTYAWDTWGAVTGLHSITARARDNYGQPSTSAVVYVIANPPPPGHNFIEITVTSPTNTTVLGQGCSFPLIASTSSNRPIVDVEFYDGDVKIGDGIGHMNVFTFVWNTTGIAYGPHTIRAKATNIDGYAVACAPLTIEVRVPGDANGDGVVDGLDYGMWQVGYGLANPTFQLGDFNNDGVVNGLDYGVWQAHYGVHATDDTPTAQTATETATATARFLDSLRSFGMTDIKGAAPRIVALSPGPGVAANNVTTIVIAFDRPVTVGAGAVEVCGEKAGDRADYVATYSVAAQGESTGGQAASGTRAPVDPPAVPGALTTYTLTLTFARPLAADRYTVRVIADFVVGGGGCLDGEVGDGLPSGDGAAGGDAVFEFSVE